MKNMKNWKVKKKLFISHGIIILMSMIIALGGAFGMIRLNGAIDMLTDKAIPNTERVWEIRRNLQSEAADLLLAASTDDQKRADQALEEAMTSLERNKALLQELRENSAMDASLFTRLDDCLARQESPRSEFHRLMRLGTPEATEQAHDLLVKDFIPILSEEASLLRDTCIAIKESQEILKTVIGDISYLLNEMADGNFDVRSHCPDEYVGELESVLQSIRAINFDLSDALAQIIGGADQVAAGADQVSTGAQTLAQGATEQASTVEELSATISEISTQSQENAQDHRNHREYRIPDQYPGAERRCGGCPGRLCGQGLLRRGRRGPEPGC